MAKGILRDINRTYAKVRREIKHLASHGKYGAGQSTEGYAGGYVAALHDVEAALRLPNERVRKLYLWRNI